MCAISLMFSKHVLLVQSYNQVFYLSLLTVSLRLWLTLYIV